RRRPGRAERHRPGPDRGHRAPDPRSGGERAGAAQPLARRPRAPPHRGAERLGRHLAAHARLRQPRGPVAARRGARGHLPRRRLHAPRAPRDLSRALAAASPAVRRILERALDHRELSAEEGEALLAVRDADLLALVRTADTVRAADVGDEVTYVVNRNINFTNVCFVNCQFCAFKRQRWEDDAYTHGVDVVLGKVEEAIARGATEVCMQGGINPEMGAFTYRDMLLAIKSRFPEIHVHAFSPMEILYGARRTNMDYPAYIGMLRDCGLGSIPGTAAEILDDEVREILSHKKVDVRSWVEI